MKKLEKLQEIKVVGATTDWLKSPETLDVIRKTPARKFEKLPTVSIQPEVAIAIHCLTEPRETQTIDSMDFSM